MQRPGTALAFGRQVGSSRSQVNKFVNIIVMKTSFCILLAGTLALPLVAADADPKSEVKDAIKKLAGQPNYSWTFTPKTEGSEAAAKQGPIEGKAEKDGVIYLKGTTGDISFEAVAKGSKYAVNYAGEWVVVEENDEETGRIAQRLKAVKNPLEAADDLAGKAGELKKESDGLYSAELTAAGAKELFGKLGKRAAAAEGAKGAVKVWIKNGVLAKYEFHVKGTITVGSDKREVNLSRTVTRAVTGP